MSKHDGRELLEKHVDALGRDPDTTQPILDASLTTSVAAQLELSTQSLGKATISRSDGPEQIIKVTLYGASGLAKRQLLSLPDPFAILTVDGEQTRVNAIVSRTLSPVWDETFEIKVRQSSMIAIQIFDHKQFKRRDQGFLGVCYIPAADAIQFGGNPSVTITRELRKSSSSIPVSGNISVGFSFPPMPQQPSRTRALLHLIFPQFACYRQLL